MASKFIDSIPVSKLYIDKVLDLVSTRENLSLLVANGIGISSFGLGLQSKSSSIKQYVSSKLGDNIPIFVYLDLQLNPKFIEKHVSTILSSFSAQNSVGNQILEIVEKGQDIYFFIDNYSPELKERVDEILYYQTLSNKRIRYMFVLKYQYYTAEQIGGLKFYHNTIKLAFLDKSEAIEWLKLNAGEMDVEIHDKDLEMIYEYCGGVPILLKNALRIYREVESVQEVFKQERFQSLLKKYIARFSKEERKILYNLVWALPINSSVRELEYLKDIRLVDNSNKIIGKWLLDVFMQDKPKLALTKNGLASERVDLENVLTKKRK